MPPIGVIYAHNPKDYNPQLLNIIRRAGFHVREFVNGHKAHTAMDPRKHDEKLGTDFPEKVVTLCEGRLDGVDASTIINMRKNFAGRGKETPVIIINARGEGKNVKNLPSSKNPDEILRAIKSAAACIV